MKIHRHDEDTMISLIRRWCNITQTPYDNGLAYLAVANLEDYIGDEFIDDPDNPDATWMKPNRVIDEYIYFVEGE